jgi:hypothetical protein
MVAKRDRTGELCPFCKEGKLYPLGKASFSEPSDKPEFGIISEASREYECDKCHKKADSMIFELTNPNTEKSVNMRTTARFSNGEDT